jgi:succinate-semialdehyde dehydrogenase/glutarate-semialdehyde dehydrogenase
MFIDGRWRGGLAGQPVINPADGSTITYVPHATRDDLDDAVAAAARGFALWSRI